MAEKTKIGYVSIKPLDDVRTWSGTVNNLYLALAERYEIVPIIISKPKFFKLVDKVFEILRISYYPPFYSRYYRLAFACKIKNLDNVDILFGCALSHIFGSGIDKKDKKIIYLSDAVFSQMVGYYWFDLSEQRKNALDKLEANSLKLADQLIYSSDWARLAAIESYGVSEDKVSMLPFPAPLEDSFIDNKSVEKEEINLLFVGVDWKRKGVDNAINCIDALNASDKNHKYVLNIVGLTSDKQYNNVVFHGRLSRDDIEQRKKLVALYQNSDFFILPTKADCSPVVFSEAYEYGLPIISTRTGGVNYLVLDGETGLLFDVNEDGSNYAKRVMDLVNKPDEYKRISDACRQRFLDYHSRESWLSAFDKIVTKLNK